MKINFLRAVILLIGLTGLVWFLLPVLTHRILNIGNGSGLLLSGFLIFYAITFLKFNSEICILWQNRLGRILLSAISLLLVAGILFTSTAIGCMIILCKRNPDANQTLIVLGCRVYGEKASLMLSERLEAALSYLNENEDSICVLSGGKGKGENISEAECMYRFLLNHGISKERLLKEEQSTSTRENLAFSKKIIKTNHLNQKIAIATNEFHEYRASKIAKELGLEATAVCGRTAWWLLPTYAAREVFGIIYEWFL